MKSPTDRLARALALGLIIVVVGLIGGCGDDSGDGATAASNDGGGGAAKLTVVASGADSYPYMAMLTIAKDKGWFAEEGVDLNVLAASGGGDTVRVATTGSADVAISSGTTIIPVAEQGQLRILGPWYQVNDFSWLSPEPVELRDVESAKLGIVSAGSSSELMIKGIQKEFPNVEGVVAGSLGENWAAAKSDRLTGGLELPPYTNQLVAEEDAQVVVQGRDVLGDLPANFVAARPEYLEAHPEALKGFWRAADRAMTYAREQPDAAAAELTKLIPIDEKYLREALEQYKAGYDVKVNPEVLANLSDLMVEVGAIEEPLDWATLMDQSFLPAEAQADL